MTHTLHRKRYARAVAWTLLFAAAIAWSGQWFLIHNRQWLPPAASFPIIVLTAAAATAAAIPSWRASDEMQRDGQLRSWYWGGAFGGLVGLWSALLFAGRMAAIGAIIVVVAQISAFLLFRVAFRLNRRAAAQ